jgi:hypothetical protein
MGLIIETVTSEFEFSDHDFMTARALNHMTLSQEVNLGSLLRSSED